MTAHEAAVTIGFDAVRLALGTAPKTWTPEQIIRWLTIMKEKMT
jgi:hypothetical protein